MTGRVLRIELRRSDARWIAVSIGLLGGLLVYLGAPRWFWAGLAVHQREMLGLLLPLVLGGAAWQGLRERRSRVAELIAASPRPRWSRVLPTASALAIGGVVGYLAMSAVGIVVVVATRAVYFPPGYLATVGIGALAVVAAAWIGLAIGSRLPSLLTPPLLVIVGVAALLITPETIHASARPQPAPGYLALFPSVDLTRDGPKGFIAVTAAAHLAQVLWLVAVAAGGLVWLGAVRRRTQVLAVLPAVAGLIGALAVLPATTVGPDAGALVPFCTTDVPRVCLTRLNAPALDAVRGPARQALALMAAKLPAPPSSVVVTDTWATGVRPPRRADTVYVDLQVEEKYGRPVETPAEMLWRIASGAGTRPCDVAETDERYYAARLVAAAWLVGRPPAEVPLWTEPLGSGELIDQAWQDLTLQPYAEQQARVAALREAELACDGRDRLSILTGQP
jgi:hypothetical protein